jgi:hypothetical protein
MGKEKRQSPSTLLWFIRHKSYVPISEIRRRFMLDTDDGSFIQAGGQRRAYVGLPPGTAQSIEKLWQQGKIGLEFSVEFDAHVLIGVFPMNPSKEALNGHGPAHGFGRDHLRRAPENRPIPAPILRQESAVSVPADEDQIRDEVSGDQPEWEEEAPHDS